MKLTEDRRKLLKVASLYYEDGLTQAKIAKEMGISRPVISKMLQLAKEEGIVRISLKADNLSSIQLANDLIRKYQLTDVIVVPLTKGNGEQIQRAVAQSAAAFITSLLPNIHSIGLSWGTTLAAVVEEMTYQKLENFVIRPLVGGVASEHVYYDTNHLVFQLAEKLGASCSYLYAPALAENQKVAQVLNQSQLVKVALAEAKVVDLAVIGVGNPQKNSTWSQFGYLSADCLSNHEIIGDALGSLFDKHGKTIDNDITERMIGLKVEALLEMKQTLLVVAGSDKSISVDGLLKGGGTNLLVVDQQLGQALLALK